MDKLETALLEAMHTGEWAIYWELAQKLQSIA
jgi:hypothetical protein